MMMNTAIGEQKSRKEMACSMHACPEELASLSSVGAKPWCV